MTVQATEQHYSTSSNLMKPCDVMKLLQVSRSTLHRYTKLEGLKPIKMGRALRYRRVDVDAWLESRKQGGGN